MPKFMVVRTTNDYYEVEADTEDDAINTVIEGGGEATGGRDDYEAFEEND